MNEELKIIIKGVTDDIERKLDEVKQQLKEVEEQAKETGEKAKKASKEASDGIKTVIASVVALTTAFVALSKSSLEFQKAQARLVSGFRAVGSTAEQATKTYKELFGFLGDTGTATEAANLLAQITTEEQKLNEWTNILKGAYATFPDSLPVEALAESTNETIKAGKIAGNLADALVWLGVSEDAVNQQLASLNTESEREVYLRNLLNSLYGNAANIYDINNQSMIKMNKSQADMDIALARATQYIKPLLTSFYNMAAVLLEALAPALNLVANILMVLISWIAAVARAINAVFGGFKSGGAEAGNAVNDVGNSLDNAANNANDLGNALNSAAGAAKELKRQTMGFDELNVVSDNSSGGGGASVGGGASNFEIPEIDTSGVDAFTQKIEDAASEVEGLGVVIAGIAIGLAAWKLVGFISDIQTGVIEAGKLQTVFKNIGGVLMLAAGAMLLLDGYSDAWANGIDWGNFAETIAGVGLVVGGLFITFGTLAAQIGLVIGGILLIVLGVKDLIENGYSMEAVIMVTIGVIGVLIGVIWAFNAALLANPITWIIAAIIALVAVFVILWNECDWFREFWVNLWEIIKEAFRVVWEWLKQAAKDIGQFFVDAWEVIKKAFSFVGDFFFNKYKAIKDIFIGVAKFFGDIFSEAWEAIKKAFSSVGSFFSGIWDSIKSIFSKVGSAIGDAVSGAFKSAINWVLEKAIGIINGFISAINAAIGVINLIPGVDIKKISKLEVPQLAEGGIVTSDTLARIGEQGYREAVLPLERNTEWMDILADRINGGNKPSKIVLMLDGNELGWANIRSINQITKQTGELQLTLV